MVFLRVVLGAFRTFVIVGFVFLLLGLIGISAWPGFEYSVPNLITLFVLATGLELFATY